MRTMEQTNLSWSAVLKLQPPDETQPQKYFFEDFTLEELEQLEEKYFYYHEEQQKQLFNELEQV